MQEGWYEKLHEWNKALKAYETKQENTPDDINLTLGRMRCLEALAEWWVILSEVIRGGGGGRKHSRRYQSYAGQDEVSRGTGGMVSYTKWSNKGGGEKHSRRYQSYTGEDEVSRGAGGMVSYT